MTQIKDLVIKIGGFMTQGFALRRKILPPLKFYDTKRCEPRGINPTICNKI
jgi:hypothetical protein